jgi:hypothetical protein
MRGLERSVANAVITPPLRIHAFQQDESNLLPNAADYKLEELRAMKIRNTGALASLTSQLPHYIASIHHSTSKFRGEAVVAGND